MTDRLTRWIVGPNDDPVTPSHVCRQCGASYYQQRAAHECCLLTNGGTNEEVQQS